LVDLFNFLRQNEVTLLPTPIYIISFEIGPGMTMDHSIGIGHWDEVPVVRLEHVFVHSAYYFLDKILAKEGADCFTGVLSCHEDEAAFLGFLASLVVGRRLVIY
jgi:hypothetical protein